MDHTSFSNITLLITHYNRSKSLERLLSTFKELEIKFGGIIVSDDCSKKEHLDAIQNLKHKFDFELITAPINKGLGNNINKGQDAVKTPYTLYVQEDFIPTLKFQNALANSLTILEKNNSFDLIKFYAYYIYPYLKLYKDGFSEMIYKPWFSDTSKIYIYTDHPHLRRSTFLNKFGRYNENSKLDRTEYLMCVSFIQNKGKSLFYNKFTELFIQQNSQEEPSTVKRSNWRNSNNIIIKIIRIIYRQVKYNYEIHFGENIKNKTI